MLIELITSDFKGAEYANPWDCPLARALKRYFPDNEILIFGWGLIKKDGVLVNGRHVLDQENGVKGWDGDSVCPMIERANAGEEVTFTLEVIGLENELKS